MRGTDEASGSRFRHVDPEEGIPARHPPWKIRSISDEPASSFLIARFIRSTWPPLGKTVHWTVFLILVAPGVFDLGEPVLDPVLAADAVEKVFEGMNMPFRIGDLDSSVGEQDVEPVGPGCDQVAQESRGGHFPSLPAQLPEGDLGSAVDGDEQGERYPTRRNRMVIKISR